jgi:Rhs element Vgr protein
MGAAQTIKSSSVVTWTVKVDGSDTPDHYQIYSIAVEQKLNRITSAEIMLLDGSGSQQTFDISSDDTFVPGKKVTIEAGYDSQNKTIFSGFISKQSLRIGGDIGSVLTVECKDQALKMTIGRQSAKFTDMTDSAVISTLIGQHSGLSADVTSTTAKQAELVQYYSSDWDFMLCRAEVNGLFVSNSGGKVRVFKPEANTSPVLVITYGDNLVSFNADLNTVNQLAKVTATAWDPDKQQLLNSEVSNSQSGPGNINSKKLSEVVGLKTFELQTPAPADKAALTDWANAQLLKTRFGKVTGEVRFQGTELVKAGDFITLKGLGERFNGDHLVSGVSHEIIDGNWFVTAQLGLDPQWFVQEPEVMAPTASGLLPGVSWLHSGKVKKIDEDPDSGFRILLDLPLFDNKKQGIWSRLANFYSTKGAGAFFLPEIGDEVIVGFINDDPRYPVILGSLYSKGVKPFAELKPNNKNSHKAIVSKSELRMVFNDEDKILTLTTPGKNLIEFSDKDKKITISDQNKNTIVMSNAGIELKSAGTISIDAGKKVTIKGKTGVTIAASSGDVATSGININEKASAQFTASGSASATVKGGGKLTLKGGLVMIN